MSLITDSLTNAHIHTLSRTGTFVARWIGSDGGIHVEARTYNEIISSTQQGSKPTRKQSIDDIMRLAKKIGGDRVLSGVRKEVEKVWKIVREERDGLILYVVFERGVREYYLLNVFQSFYFLRAFQLCHSNCKNITHSYKR